MKNNKRFKKVIAFVIVSAALFVSFVVTCFAYSHYVITNLTSSNMVWKLNTSSYTINANGGTFSSDNEGSPSLTIYSHNYIACKFDLSVFNNKLFGFTRYGQSIMINTNPNDVAIVNLSSSLTIPSDLTFYDGTYAQCIGKLREWNMFTSNFADSMLLTNHSDVLLNLVTYAGSGTAVADGTTSITGLKAVMVGDSLTAGKYLLFDHLPAESDDYQIFDNYIVKADEAASLDFVSDELISELNYYSFDTYAEALAQGQALGLIDMPSVGEQLVDAMTAGFGMAPSFGSMVQDTFKSVFLTSEVDEQGNVSITGLSDFGSVSLILVGIAVVTGLGMLIFRRFFKRS